MAREPMKRHEALASLSRDHHHALMLARGLKKTAHARLQRGLPPKMRGRVAHTQRFFTEKLEPHFAAEETILLPTVRGRNAVLDEIVDGIVEDHRRIRALVQALADSEDPADALDKFAHALETHVRIEERRLFERVQEALSEDELRALGPRLEQAKHA